MKVSDKLNIPAAFTPRKKANCRIEGWNALRTQPYNVVNRKYVLLLETKLRYCQSQESEKQLTTTGSKATHQ